MYQNGRAIFSLGALRVNSLLHHNHPLWFRLVLLLRYLVTLTSESFSQGKGVDGEGQLTTHFSVGRDMMHAAGLSWFLPARYIQPSFITSTGYRRRNSGNEEESEDIDMDILIDDQHDSSVEYDYDLSEDEPNDDEVVSTTYPRRQR